MEQWHEQQAAIAAAKAQAKAKAQSKARDQVRRVKRAVCVRAGVEPSFACI